MNVQLDELHKMARLAIEPAERAAEPDLRQAADCLARAAKLGASQRQSGKAVHRSAPWVNMLLKWRDSGYSYSSPFHPLKAEPKCSSDEHQDEESRHPSGTEQTAAETGQACWSQFAAFVIDHGRSHHNQRTSGVDCPFFDVAAAQQVLMNSTAHTSMEDCDPIPEIQTDRLPLFIRLGGTTNIPCHGRHRVREVH